MSEGRVPFPVVSLFSVRNEADVVMFVCPTGECDMVRDSPCPYCIDNKCSNVDVQLAAMEAVKDVFLDALQRLRAAGVRDSETGGTA